MALFLALLFALTAYIGVVGFFVYFCMFADPSTSPVAEFLTETLPSNGWKQCEKLVGRSNLKIVEWFADRFMILIYVVIVFGSWSVIFFYVYPWMDKQTYVSHYHKQIGYVVFSACVVSWRYASTSSPGIITKNNLAIYNHFPYDELMFTANKRCATRKIPRLARSKFDRFKYNENIPRFDHFCGWVFNTIGEENYRWFLLFLVVHVGMCLYGTIIMSSLFYGHLVEQGLHKATLFNRVTGEEIAPGNWFILSQYLFHRFFMESGVVLLMGVMAITLGLFLFYHIWITSKGLTTNETYKWDEIQKWYSLELKRYKDAVKDGTIVEAEKATPPTVSDGDVTCTPGSSTTNEKDESLDDIDAVQDPGPPPVNIYNRGLVENWKEVLFPISLRKQRQLKQSVSKNKVS